jgi:hypothetical protein
VLRLGIQEPRAEPRSGDRQLKRYALALENPPLLIACHLDRFHIATNWTNAVSATHEFDLDGLFEPDNRQKLKWAFDQPEQLRPGLTRRHVTETAAQKFASSPGTCVPRAMTPNWWPTSSTGWTSVSTGISVGDGDATVKVFN